MSLAVEGLGTRDEERRSGCCRRELGSHKENRKLGLEQLRAKSKLEARRILKVKSRMAPGSLKPALAFLTSHSNQAARMSGSTLASALYSRQHKTGYGQKGTNYARACGQWHTSVAGWLP